MDGHHLEWFEPRVKSSTRNTDAQYNHVHNQVLLHFRQRQCDFTHSIGVCSVLIRKHLCLAMTHQVHLHIYTQKPGDPCRHVHRHIQYMALFSYDHVCIMWLSLRSPMAHSVLPLSHTLNSLHQNCFLVFTLHINCHLSSLS